MLRGILLGLGGLALLCGLVGIAAGVLSPMVTFGIWGAIMVLLILCERVVYKRTLKARPGPGWQRTTERFVDEKTGEPVTVYIEPATGERAYVRE